MSLIEINRPPTRRELRIFSAGMVVFFGLVAAWVFRRMDSPRVAVAIAVTGTVLGVAGLLAPALARYVFLGWMWLAMPIGWIVSHAVLVAVFYLVLTPVGLIMKLIRRDAMRRRFDAAASSYWLPRHRTGGIERYFRQF